MRIYINFFIFLILCFLSIEETFAQAKGPAKKNVEVVIGQDKSVFYDFPPASRNAIEIGQEELLELVHIPSKREIVLKGMKPGTTSLTIRKTTGEQGLIFNVRITKTNNSQTVQELREFLGDIEGIEIGIKGGAVYIGGQIVVPNDFGRIKVILDRYKDVLVLAELSPQTKVLVSKRMQTEIQKAGMKNVTVRYVNDQYWLEGIVSSNDQRAKAELIAGAYLPDDVKNLGKRTGVTRNVGKELIQNFINVNAESKPAPVPKLVKITAQFVELTKDYNKVFGFKWIPLLTEGAGQINIGKTNNGGVSTQSAGTLSATISNLFPKLASARSAGYARVIQSGVVVTKDGVKTSINKSSEKNFAIGSGEFLKSGVAKSGFDLNAKPKILEGEKVDLEVSIAISATIGTPPEVLSNKVSTSLVVKSKESAVVGGIVISRNATDYDRDPPFGSPQFDESTGTTPLFSFLRSKSYVNSRSQFVVFVTPEIIESASEGTNEIKRKFRQRRR